MKATAFTAVDMLVVFGATAFGVGAVTAAGNYYTRRNSSDFGLPDYIAAHAHTVTGVPVMHDLLTRVGDNQVCADMIYIIEMHKKYGDKLAQRFATYGPGDAEMAALNDARRRMDMLYYHGMVMHRRRVLTDGMIGDIFEPGSVAAFLKFVQPLSECKRGAKPCMAEQRAFYERFAQVPTAPPA